MAVRNIAVTDTIEKFRTEFNALCLNDFGDIGNLSGSISSTNLVDAMNETISIATSTAGWTIEDSSSTRQVIGGGDILRVFGTSNEIEAVVSATDTLTIGLPNNVTIGNNLTVTNDVSITNDLTVSNNLTVTNNLTTSGLSTLGTIEINGNTIRSTDSTRINVNDVFRANELETQDGLLRFDKIGAFPRIQSTKADNVVVFDAIPAFNASIIFEGATADNNELTITATDPTADRTLTIPDVSGAFVTTGDTGTITSTMILNGTISNDDIADDQISEAKMADDAIGQNQLKSVVNLQILNSSGTTLKSLFAAGA